MSTEFGTTPLPAGGQATFGRGADVDLRVGAAPVHDDLVPRLSGRIFAVDDRIYVENLHDTLAIDIRPAQRALLALAPGDIHSPRDRTFDVVVTGAVTSYELAVRVNVDLVTPRRIVDGPSGSDADPATGTLPELTQRQRDILDAYVAPLRAGGLVASHQQVADALGVSRSLVRVECERIWSSLFLAGVPMRDLRDARDEIVDAWSRHRF